MEKCFLTAAAATPMNPLNVDLLFRARPLSVFSRRIPDNPIILVHLLPPATDHLSSDFGLKFNIYVYDEEQL